MALTSTHRSFEGMSQRSRGVSLYLLLAFLSFEASSLQSGCPSTLISSSILEWKSPHLYTVNTANFKNYLGSLIAKKAWAARLKTLIIVTSSHMKDSVQGEFDLEASPNDWSSQVTYHTLTWNSLKKEVFTILNHSVWWFFASSFTRIYIDLRPGVGKDHPCRPAGEDYFF